MQPDTDLAALLDRLRAGEPSAANEIVQRYARQLVQLASRRIAGGLRRKVDPEDLVQSAFRSFFRLNPAERFQLDDWDALWGILATLTIRKFHRRLEYHLASRRSISREEEISSPGGSLEPFTALARDPSPAEAAELADLVERLLAGLNDQTRQIAEYLLQGFSRSEIAGRVGVTERTVVRQVERIRSRLEDLHPSPASAPP